MEENELTPTDYWKILKRRKWYLLIPFFLIVIIAGAVALLLPPVYKSTATILIEQREIPEEYVTASMTTYAEQRIQSINQRVLTSTRLMELINQFDLYADDRQKKTMDEIIDGMRLDIKLEPVSVEIADRRTGRAAMATIAFTLSYVGNNPGKVQKVANTITTMFLEEDLKVRKEQASSTYEFLETEMERVQRDLAEYESRLTSFKQQHVNTLPELFQVNMQALENVQRNIDRTKETLRSLREKESALESELANTPKDIQDVMNQRELKEDNERRLESLKMELINLRTKFSDQYPDVKKLKQEIAELSEKVAQDKARQDAEKESKEERVNNPAYVTMRARLAGIRTDIASVRNNLADLEKEAIEYQARLAATPEVEQKYNALISQRNTLNLKLSDLQAKMMEARVSQAVETEQKGERFSLVESARLPDKPFKPNRLAIVLIGIVLGIGAGVGFAAIAEFSDTSFRDGDSLARATGFPVLTEVTWIITPQERMKIRLKRVTLFVVAVGIIAAAVFCFHVYVMDLNVFWAKVMRRLS
jgi:polysaccharide chain length determinant protein (PEP-CTERM system associated)